jgi:hypothetical protein
MACNSLSKLHLPVSQATWVVHVMASGHTSIRNAFLSHSSASMCWVDLLMTMHGSLAQPVQDQYLTAASKLPFQS